MINSLALPVVSKSRNAISRYTKENVGRIKINRSGFLQVFHHGESKLGDSHRLSVTEDPNDTFSRVIEDHLFN